MKLQEAQHQHNPWAVVTGSSTPTGAKTARKMAADGLNVVLVGGVSTQRLEQLATDIRQSHHVQTRVVPIDLSTPRFAKTLREATADLDVRMRINDTGITEPRAIDDSAQEWAWLA